MNLRKWTFIVVSFSLIVSLLFPNLVFAGSADDQDSDVPEFYADVADFLWFQPAIDMANNFANEMGNYGWVATGQEPPNWPQGGVFIGLAVSDEDWEVPSGGKDSHGYDHLRVDAADLALFIGHGPEDRRALLFCSDNSEGENWEATPPRSNWGDEDVEWVMLWSCFQLKDDDSGTKDNDRWSGSMDGVHSICGWCDPAPRHPDIAQVGWYLGSTAITRYAIPWAWFYSADVFFDPWPNGPTALRAIVEDWDYFWEMPWRCYYGGSDMTLPDPTVDGQFNVVTYYLVTGPPF